MRTKKKEKKDALKSAENTLISNTTQRLNLFLNKRELPYVFEFDHFSCC